MSKASEELKNEMAALQARLDKLESAGGETFDGDAVVVTTSKRGVFFGYIDNFNSFNVGDDAALLAGARNCIYWSSDVGGVLGLCVTGPSESCRIGAQVPGQHEMPAGDITSVTQCTAEAEAAWNAAATYKG